MSEVEMFSHPFCNQIHACLLTGNDDDDDDGDDDDDNAPGGDDDDDDDDDEDGTKPHSLTPFDIFCLSSFSLSLIFVPLFL